MTEERKKEILKTIEERISSIPEKYVSKVIADWFFCSGEEDLIEVAKNIKRKDSDLSQHMRDWYVKTRGCTKTEMAIVLTDPEFMLTSSLKDKILSQNSIRLMQNDREHGYLWLQTRRKRACLDWKSTYDRQIKEEC